MLVIFFLRCFFVSFSTNIVILYSPLRVIQLKIPRSRKSQLSATDHDEKLHGVAWSTAPMADIEVYIRYFLTQAATSVASDKIVSFGTESLGIYPSRYHAYLRYRTDRISKCHM